MPGRVDARTRLLGLAMLVTTSCVGCLPSGAATLPAANYRDATTSYSASYDEPTGMDTHLSADRSVAAGKRRERAIDAVSLLSDDTPELDLEPEVPSRDWRYIVLHHTATEQGDVASIDEQHRRQLDRTGQPWLGIGYHFVIGNGQPMSDGHIEPTFRWREQLHGAHAGEEAYNDRGIGICLVGNFEQRPPTAKQLVACRRLVAELARRYDIAPERVVAHRDVKATECPGRLFPLEEMASAAKKDPLWSPRRMLEEEVQVVPEAAAGALLRQSRTVWPDLSTATRRR